MFSFLSRCLDWLLIRVGVDRNPLNRVQVLVLTIIDVEFHSAAQVFFDGGGEDYFVEGRRYRVGQINTRVSPKKRIGVAIVCAGEPGLSAATSVCAMAYHALPSIELIVLCGVSGGVARPDILESHVRLGDIVIGTDKPINVSFGKWTADGFQPRPQILNPPDRKCRSIALDLTRMAHGEPEETPQWEKYRKAAAENLTSRGVFTPLHNCEWGLPTSGDVLYDYDGHDRIIGTIDHPADEFRERYPYRPVVHTGLIVSGDYVGKSARETRERHSREDLALALAYEMESSGIAKASTDRDINYFVIRGVVDYQNPAKNDEWHPTGALRASAMARCIVEMREFSARPSRRAATPRLGYKRLAETAEIEPEVGVGSPAIPNTGFLGDGLEKVLRDIQTFQDEQNRESLLATLAQLENAIFSGQIPSDRQKRVAFAAAHALVVCLERDYLENDDQVSKRLERLLAMAGNKKDTE